MKSNTCLLESPISKLLPRLKGVVNRGNGQYIAQCPAHEDNSPSLSIKECPDQTILIKCFAECGAADVVSSIGLEMRDLFPAQLDKHIFQRGKKQKLSARDLLFILKREILNVYLAAEQINTGGTLSDADRLTLEKACQRILRVTEYAANV